MSLAIVPRSCFWGKNRLCTLKVTSVPAAKPNATTTPNGLAASMLLEKTSPPRLSITTSAPEPFVHSLTRSTKSSVFMLITRSAPVCSANSRLSSLRMVVATLAPNAFATWISMLPEPDAPAWTSTWSPAFTSPTFLTARTAVASTTGNVATSSGSRPVSSFTVARAGTSMYWA